MLVETDRWGEEKGQCGESERERERNRWQQKESCWAQQGVWKAKKCQQKEDTEKAGRQSSEGQGGNDRKRLNIPPVRTGLTGTRLNSTLGQSGNING